MAERGLQRDGETRPIASPRDIFGSFAAGIVCGWSLLGCAALRTDNTFPPSARNATVSVPASAHCAFSPVHPEKKNCCEIPPYQTMLGVDDAFRRIAIEYRFGVQPRAYDDEAEAVAGMSHGHEFYLVPGQLYRVKGIVVPASDPQLYRGVWIGFELTLVRPGLTGVTAAYCHPSASATLDQEGWHRSIQDSIRNVLPPSHP